MKEKNETQIKVEMDEKMRIFLENKRSRKALVSTAYGVQKERIAAHNRVMSMRYDKLICEEKECRHTIWLMEEKDHEKIGKPCPKCECDMVLIPQIPPLKLPELEEVENQLGATEKYLLKQFKSIIEKEVIWHGFLSHVQGISYILGLGLTSQINIFAKRPDGSEQTISSLWRYAGYGDIDKETNTAKGRKVGETFSHNAFLKTTCWKICKSFIMQDAKTSFYRRMYDQFKADEKLKHPEEISIDTGRKNKKGKTIIKKLYTKGHLHNRAMRKTVKLFLAHLWLQWRQLEDLPITEPYIVAQGGHTFISWEPDKVIKKEASEEDD